MKFLYVTMFVLGAFVINGNGQTNIIEDQTNWPFGDYVNAATSNPQTNDLPNSSYWCSGTSSQFNGTNGALVCGPIPDGSSMTWWTYFAPSNSPVTLKPGYTLQTTWNFMVYGTGVQNVDRHLRVGLLYFGANQSTNPGTVSGEGVQGYAQQMNFCTNFGEAPLQTVADTNINDDVSVFSKSADFIQIGANGGGNTNDPGFTDGIPYAMVVSIAEQGTNSINITTTVFGSTLTNGMITQTVTDTNYCYTNFDGFVVRPNDGGTTATNFTTTELEVETFPTPGPGPIMASIKAFPTNTIVLSWNSISGDTYSIFRTNTLGAPQNTWPEIKTGFPTGGADGGTIFYTDRPAGALEFYKISSP